MRGLLICAFSEPDICVECPFCRVDQFREFYCWIADILLDKAIYEKSDRCPLLQVSDEDWDALKLYIKGRNNTETENNG